MFMNHQETKQMFVLVLDSSGQNLFTIIYSFCFPPQKKHCKSLYSRFSVLHIIPHTLSAFVFLQCKLGYKPLLSPCGLIINE